MRICAFLLILSAAGGSASAQSLADVARKESERRQTVKTDGKSYTNKDLKAVPATPAPADGAGLDASKTADQSMPADATAKDDLATAGTADQRTSNTGDTSEVKDEAYWSQRMSGLRTKLDRDQTFLDALQRRINALTTDFVNRDDPAQRGQIANDRQRALAELDRLKKAIEVDTRAIAALEDQARRAGVPAGWLRQ